MRRLPVQCLLFLCIVSFRLQAQQQYLFTHLGVRDGLASNAVMSLQQDAKGYIWIATREGLERYDGYRFLLYIHKEKGGGNSLPNNTVLQIQLDSSNRLWVLCEYNKAGYIDLADLKYHEAAVMLSPDITSRAAGRLYVDKAGNVILILASKAVLTYDKNIRTFIPGNLPFPLPKGWVPSSLFQDGSSNYWLGSDSGLIKYSPTRQTLSYRGHNDDRDPVIENYGPLIEVSFPYLDKSGRFWLLYWPRSGAPPSYFSLDIRSGKRSSWGVSIGRILHGQYQELHFIHEQPDGTIWFAGMNLLAVLKPGSDGFELVQSNAGGEFSLYYDIVQSLLEDREHNIWLATDRGVYRFNPEMQLFHSVASRRPGKDSVFTPDVTDVLQTSDGDIVAATWGSGLFAYDSNFRPVNRWYVNQGRRLGEHGLWCIRQRANGDLWRGHQHGILYISHQATHITEKVELPVFRHSTIRQIAEDKAGNLWLGTQSGDLLKWDASSNTFSLALALNNTIQRLYSDWKGNIWVCTKAEGLYHVAASNGTIIHHYTGGDGRGLSAIGTADIRQLSDSLYAVASGSLDLLNVETGVIRPAEHGGNIPFNGISNIVRDRKGYLWVTSSNGLRKLNTKNEIRSFFNEEDGLGANAFSMASSCLLKDGRIVFGTVHDMIVFQPADITGSSQPPPDVEITNVAVQNRWISTDSLARLSDLQLSYADNSVHFTFSTLTYQNRFGISYKLENLDKDWNSGQINDAVYNYLPPGNYVFRVKANNADDVSSPHVREIAITIKNPFWRTWWFLCFMLLLGAIFLYWLDRQRMQRKEALEKMRSDISGNLHEEINKALQNINVLSEIARIKADKAPEQSVNYINEIHHKSHNMIIAMDDMLWTIDPVNDNMARTADRMKEFAEALCHRHHVNIRLQTAADMAVLRPDMKIRYELLLIYKLILRLLVEEMKAPDTLVELDYHRNLLHLSFYSAGVRTNDQNTRLIRLLEEAKTRAITVRGTLDLQSDEKGTAVLFTCPSTF
ncbi:MAG TPA: two-component regulator propeller domain-containing protein [Puia sp.]|nr:two-component regulator propeller domain-containing protein [Puia sp.]